MISSRKGESARRKRNIKSTEEKKVPSIKEETTTNGLGREGERARSAFVETRLSADHERQTANRGTRIKGGDSGISKAS